MRPLRLSMADDHRSPLTQFHALVAAAKWSIQKGAPWMISNRNTVRRPRSWSPGKQLDPLAMERPSSGPCRFIFHRDVGLIYRIPGAGTGCRSKKKKKKKKKMWGGGGPR